MDGSLGSYFVYCGVMISKHTLQKFLKLTRSRQKSTFFYRL